MIRIAIRTLVGEFAENKDTARDMRITQLEPALARGESVVIDFEGVTGATQSFIHALISEPFRQYGRDFLGKVAFKGCNETIKKIITIVTEYLQEAV